MNIYEFSGIARPIDFKYPTNKLITILSAMALVGGFILGFVHGLVLGKSVLLGLQFAATVFLTWAFAREIDPHEPYSAFVAVGIVSIGFVWGIRPDLLSIMVVMGAARILICSCGRQPVIPDALIILGGAAWLAYSQHQGLTVLVVALAFLLDGLLKPSNRLSLLFGFLALLGGIATFFFFPIIPNISPSLLNSNMVVLVLFLVFMFIAYKRPEAPADSNNFTIARKRLLAFHLLLLVWVLLAMPVYAGGSVNKLFIVWGAMAASSMFAIANGILSKKAGNVGEPE
jgi:hypothetical protein